jgi:hypothetical protein
LFLALAGGHPSADPAASLPTGGDFS